jgi:hypothetical protein
MLDGLFVAGCRNRSRVEDYIAAREISNEIPCYATWLSVVIQHLHCTLYSHN